MPSFLSPDFWAVAYRCIRLLPGDWKGPQARLPPAALSLAAREFSAPRVAGPLKPSIWIGAPSATRKVCTSFTPSSPPSWTVAGPTEGGQPVEVSATGGGTDAVVVVVVTLAC